MRPSAIACSAQLEHAQITHLGPTLCVQPVQKIKVNVVGLQFLQLLVEVPVKILGGFDQPTGQLGCQLDPFSVSAFERPPEEPLTVSAMIGIGRVNIVHAVVNGIVDHACRFRLVNVGAVASCCWESHTPESQRRAFPIQSSKFAVLHVCPPEICVLDAHDATKLQPDTPRWVVETTTVLPRQYRTDCLASQTNKRPPRLANPWFAGNLGGLFPMQ